MRSDTVQCNACGRMTRGQIIPSVDPSGVMGWVCMDCHDRAFAAEDKAPREGGLSRAADRVHRLIQDGRERITSVIRADARVADVLGCVQDLRRAGATVTRRIVTFPTGDAHYAWRMTEPVPGRLLSQRRPGEGGTAAGVHHPSRDGMAVPPRLRPHPDGAPTPGADRPDRRRTA